MVAQYQEGNQARRGGNRGGRGFQAPQPSAGRAWTPSPPPRYVRPSLGDLALTDGGLRSARRRHDRPESYSLQLPHEYTSDADLPKRFNWCNKDGVNVSSGRAPPRPATASLPLSVPMNALRRPGSRPGNGRAWEARG